MIIKFINIIFMNITAHSLGFSAVGEALVLLSLAVKTVRL